MILEKLEPFETKNIKDFYDNFKTILECLNLCSKSLFEMEENLIIDKSDVSLS